MKNSTTQTEAPHEIEEQKMNEIMLILANMPTNQAKNILHLSLEYIDSFSIVSVSS